MSIAQRNGPHQQLNPARTTWHITFGAHAQRLHGGPRATVDRRHNQRGQPFIGPDTEREQAARTKLKAPPVLLSRDQCHFIESVMPEICERGGWTLRTCSASPPPNDGDHVHVLLDAPPESQPKVIRELLKRWLTQALNEQFPSSEPARPHDRADSEPARQHVRSDSEPARHHVRADSEPARPRAGASFDSRPHAGGWWADGGSTKPVKDEAYLNNAFRYVDRQRATPRAHPAT